jgi:hypothetical protein
VLDVLVENGLDDGRNGLVLKDAAGAPVFEQRQGRLKGELVVGRATVRGQRFDVGDNAAAQYLLACAGENAEPGWLSEQVSPGSADVLVGRSAGRRLCRGKSNCGMRRLNFGWL